MSFAQSVPQVAPSCTDRELIVAVRGGSVTAFEQLYSRYGAKIRAYVLRLLGDHGRAEDLTQDVFISALRRLRETQGPVAFKPWIYEIARNACIDEFRRRRRGPEISLEGPEGTGEATEGWQSLSCAPEVAIENKQRLDDLRGAFGGLSENHHRIMVMRELEGLSYGEIGARMGMSKPVVESTLFRARRRLHAEYDELVSGRRCKQVQMVISTSGERPGSSFGLRERRQLARHLSHCQPCRRAARMASVDESWFHAPGRVDKIAALLPFPWLRLRRGARGDATLPAAGAHPLSALRPLQTIAHFADPNGTASGLGRAATAVAAIVVAGAGGGIVVGLGAHDARHARPGPGARAASSAALIVGARAPGAGGGAQAPSAGAGAGVLHATVAPARGSSAQRLTLGSRAGSPPSSSSSGGPAKPTGTAARVPVPAGMSSGAGGGLLGGAGSNGVSLPKPSPIALPALAPVITNALNGPASLDLGLPKPSVSSLRLPNPDGIVPPLGRLAG